MTTEGVSDGCDFEAHRPDRETFLCDPGACVNCDDKRSILVSVSREEMLEFFGGYVVFYEAEGGRIGFRTWWQRVGGRLHQPPDSDRYFVLRTGFDKKKNDDRKFEGDETEEREITPRRD